MQIAWELVSAHDPVLVVLALAVGVLAARTSLPIFARARESVRSTAFYWIWLAGLVTGGSVWSVHFLAMIGYTPELVTGYEPAPTFLSFLISISGFCVSAAVLREHRLRRPHLVAGLVQVGTVATMHYVGMTGLIMEHGMMHNRGIVALTIVLATIPALVFASGFDRRDSNLAMWGRAACFAVSVGIVHFGGMASMMTDMCIASPIPVRFMGREMLPEFVMILTGLILSMGIAGTFMDKRSAELFALRNDTILLTDPETNCLSRAGMMHEMRTRDERNEKILLIGLSLRGYEEARSTVGPRTTRQWLQTLGEVLAQTLGEDCAVGYGQGGCFYLILKVDSNEASFAQEAVRTLVRSLSPVEFMHRDRIYRFEIVLGVVTNPLGVADTEVAMLHADFALDQAMSQRLGDVYFFDASAHSEKRERDTLALDLRVAMELGQMDLHYQPQIRINSDGTPQVIGFEALARWGHPEHGMISPGVFIPLAEETGMLSRLGEWALRRACSDFVGWGEDLHVAVNVDSSQLTDPGFPSLLRRILRETKIGANRLELEVTETGIIHDKATAKRVIEEIHALGVRVSLDDYGTGHNTLEVFFEFDFDKIKLDQTFVRGLETMPRARYVIRGVASLARQTGQTLLAEGVETAAQRDFLAKEGYAEMQGFLFQRPLPLPRLRELYAAGTLIQESGVRAA
ncbi:EAL domain, c-di-GMP-specific phosphodiesterase class I (or its enzymatically inactive variant) [Poseidonocella pacifica]|uniref:EAL domain, c-di-GMP-specific phosphodiesterase class I (Or its enzymatically inactive variant) n=1 Tax=Poseidonocella pacifica TaxID=871651 RepID=A0A1I0WFP8_9RHOB|nr:EAL domain-containing protein [Poseidonocella pacifica]SFA87038.1 EAL domain, c-di-GMP-specific phosphodiesterase class I (or its enzymatically inactive variant) [Poseidonocella pacifica]